MTESFQGNFQHLFTGTLGTKTALLPWNTLTPVY